MLTNEHLENSIYLVDVIWLVAGTFVGLRTKVQIVVVVCTQIAICVLRHALEPLPFHRLFGARLLSTCHTAPSFGLLLLVCIVQVGLRRISIPHNDRANYSEAACNPFNQYQASKEAAMILDD